MAFKKIRQLNHTELEFKHFTLTEVRQHKEELMCEFYQQFKRYLIQAIATFLGLHIVWMAVLFGIGLRTFDTLGQLVTLPALFVAIICLGQLIIKAAVSYPTNRRVLLDLELMRCVELEHRSNMKA